MDEERDVRLKLVQDRTGNIAKPASWNTLSTEIILMIMQYLTNPGDILSMAESCKSFWLIYRTANFKLNMKIDINRLPIVPALFYKKKDNEYFEIRNFSDYVVVPVGKTKYVSIKIAEKYDYLLSKIRWLDIDSSEKKTKYSQIHWENITPDKFEIFNISDIFQTNNFTNLKFLDIKHRHELNYFPETVRSISACDINFDEMEQLDQLVITNNEARDEKVVININPNYIQRLEFSAKRYKIPDIKSMTKLQILKIRGLQTTEQIDLPDDLKVYHGYVGIGQLSSGLLELRVVIGVQELNLDPINSLRDLKTIIIEINTTNVVNISNENVSHVIIIFNQVPHLSSNLMFPNATTVDLKIMSAMVWESLLFINSFMKQYRKLTNLMILHKDDLPKRIPDKNGISYLPLNYLDCDNLASSVTVFTKKFSRYKKSPGDKFMLPNTTTSLNYETDVPGTYNLSHKELVSLNLICKNVDKFKVTAPNLKALWILSDKKIDKDNFELEIPYLNVLKIMSSSCDLTHLNCKEISIQNYKSETHKLPTTYKKATLHGKSELTNNFIHPELDELHLCNDTIVNINVFQNIKKIWIHSGVILNNIPEHIEIVKCSCKNTTKVPIVK